MANEYTRIVDKQLAYARIQLGFARASEKHFSRTACLNACCLHLTEAMVAYLRELQLNSGAVQNGSSLQIIFNELRQQPQASDFRVNEVISLAFNQQSWLGNLINLQHYFRKSPTPEQKHQTTETHPADNKLIATSASLPGENSFVETGMDEPSIDLIAGISEGMENLVAGHREFSAEY